MEFSMGSPGILNRKLRPASSLVARLERLRKNRQPTPHVPLAAGRGEIGEETTAVESSGIFAAADFLPLVYDELQALAAAKMVAEKPGHTLDATALVHEAYLRLTGGSRSSPEATSCGPPPRPCAASSWTTPAPARP